MGGEPQAVGGEGDRGEAESRWGSRVFAPVSHSPSSAHRRRALVNSAPCRHLVSRDLTAKQEGAVTLCHTAGHRALTQDGAMTRGQISDAGHRAVTRGQSVDTGHRAVTQDRTRSGDMGQSDTGDRAVTGHGAVTRGQGLRSGPG